MGRVSGELPLGQRAAPTTQTFFRYGRNGVGREGRGFGISLRMAQGVRGGIGGIFLALSAKVAVEQRGRLQFQGLSCPIPCGRRAAGVARIYRFSTDTGRRGAVFLPRLDSMSLVPGILLGPVTGRRRHMGRRGATGAVARLRPLGHVSFLASPVGLRTSSREAHRTATTPFASIEVDFGRSVGRDRKSQLGIGRHAP